MKTGRSVYLDFGQHPQNTCKPLSLTMCRGTTAMIQTLVFSLLVVQQLYCCKNKKYSAHDTRGRGQHAPNMVLHRVQMQRYYILHLLPNPLSIHYISLDHPKAHKLTNHILQPSPEPCLRSQGAPGKTLHRWYRMIHVSPTGTTASFPRIL